MFKVKKLNHGGFGVEVTSPDVFGEEYETYDIGSLVSTLLVIAMTGPNIFKIGRSSVLFSETGNTGAKGLEEFKKSTKDFVEIISSELENMSEKEGIFYSHFVKDFEENGLVLPDVDEL